MKTTTLYRPVGPKELALIEASDWKAFPPRLPDQPIFYPVMNAQPQRGVTTKPRASEPKRAPPWVTHKTTHSIQSPERARHRYSVLI